MKSICTVAGLVCLFPSCPAPVAAEARPNVLFILVDDLGWSDVSYNGSRVYETPHVDRLARQGMVLTDFYSAGPVCSPTRASILTGKAPARLGLTTWLYTPEKDPPFVTHHLPLKEFTIAEALSEAGYETGYFGKWHLGYKREHWAAHQGFATAKGGLDSPHGWKLAWPDREPPLPENHTRFFSPYHMTHLENGPDGEYLTERLTDETIAFIEQHSGSSSGTAKPFFAFLSFHTVHTPLQPKPEKTDKYRKKIALLSLDGKQEQNRREKAFQNNAAYAGMVEHMDENVGRLLRRLDELKLSDDTIVICFNGSRRWSEPVGPLRWHSGCTHWRRSSRQTFA
jgi:arylsulfatase A-like enzyme